MARKGSIAGFSDVAEGASSTESSKVINNNSNVNVNNNNNKNVIDDIINNNVSKKQLIGIYFEPEVAEVLKELAKKGGKGVQSKLANEALKQLFKERGLL